MAVEWRRATLGSIATKDGYGLVDGPFGSNLPASLYTDEGVPVIRGSNLTLGTGRFRENEFVFVSNETAERLERSCCRPHDIVFTKKGTLGQTGLVPVGGKFQRYLLSSNQMKLTVDRTIADPLFVYYFVSSPQSTEKIIRDSEATGVPKTNVTYLREFPISLPPLSEQRVIAHILGTLDDKIELNRRMSETLEAMARALFKSWFVDFDPVRARMEGRDPGLPQPLADLFPARLVDSEFGAIPEGWAKSCVGDVCSRIAMGPFGSNIKTDNFVKSGVPIVRGVNLKEGFIDEGFVFVTEDKASELKNAIAFPGDIVITHRGTLGQVGLIPQNSRFPHYVVSQSQMLLRISRQRSLPRYVYMYLRSSAGQHALLANTSQTGVPAIARPTASVKGIPLLAPSRHILEAFGNIVEPLYRRRDQATESFRTLAALRDALLPKLISGQIRVGAGRRMERGRVHP